MKFSKAHSQFLAQMKIYLCLGLPSALIWVNIGSGNGLLPHGTKPLPEPMLNSHMRFLGIHLRKRTLEQTS